MWTLQYFNKTKMCKEALSGYEVCCTVREIIWHFGAIHLFIFCWVRCKDQYYSLVCTSSLKLEPEAVSLPLQKDCAQGQTNKPSSSKLKKELGPTKILLETSSLACQHSFISVVIQTRCNVVIAELRGAVDTDLLLPPPSTFTLTYTKHLLASVFILK